jgi:hypothetical protein
VSDRQRAGQPGVAGLGWGNALMAVLLAVLPAPGTTSPAHAAPPDMLRQSAGPPPSGSAVKTAILRHLQATGVTLDSRKPLRILSGPTLATGATFSGTQEQAWLMCLAVNSAKTGPGPTEPVGKTLYLRNRGGVVEVLPQLNWKDSSPRC